MRFLSHLMLWLKVVGLLALSQQVLSQSGYKYGRQDVDIPAVSPTAAANALRPLAGALPTAVGALQTATAFGAPTPTTAFGAFPQDSGLSATGSGFSPAAAGATAAGLNQAATLQTALNQRAPLRPLRPTTGLGVGNVFNPSPLQQNQFQPSSLRSGLSGSSSLSSALGGGVRGSGNDRLLEQDYEGDFSAIPGLAGVDYPIYSQVPQTSFDCSQQPLPGYYSDVEAQCQVFHICALNKTFSFLCPNGTIFSQEVLVCVWWNQYDCSTSPSLYGNNAYIYDYSERPSGSLAGNNYATNTNQLNLVNAQNRQPQTLNTLGGSAGSVGRTTPTATNIYQASNLRPANRVIGNVPVQTTPFNNGLTTGNDVGSRFGGTALNTNYPTAAQLGNQQGQPFNSVLQRTGIVNPNEVSNAIGLNPIQENQAAAAAAGNREYLPPTQRRP